MRQKPERLAWTVLLAAFAVFCAVTIACPLTVRSYLRSARRPLRVQVNVQLGTLRIERGGSTQVDATSLGDPVPLEVFKGDSILTGALDEGLLLFQRDREEERETLSSVVVYNNSRVTLVDAYAPRFGLSPNPHRTLVQLIAGRARIEVLPSSDGRPVEIEVRTASARIRLTEGSYALDVANQQTTATALRGSATILAGDQQLTISDGQLAIVSESGQLEGPLPAERNLIVNGDFNQGVATAWAQFYSGDNAARVTGTATGGQPVAWYQHEQPVPSEVGLIQTLNRNVKDVQSLVLHLQVRVNYHSLSVCGALGSECPVMVRIDYQDAAGSARQWVHGFYALEDPAFTLPYYCTTCPDPSSGDHSRVPEQAWFVYDSPNLMEIQPPELRPVLIQSVRIYASGHSYDSMVTGVELLAQE